MTPHDAASGGALQPTTATEMASLLRASADLVEALAGCAEPEDRLLLWRRLASHMAELDTLLPDEAHP